MIEETFISHLVELRDRLIRALIAIGVVFAVLCFVPGPSTIYDWLALPLTRELPMGTKMIATGVITPFMVPIKLTMMVSFVLCSNLKYYLDLFQTIRYFEMVSHCCY